MIRHSWPLLCRAILAAEEAAVVLVVLAPALQTLALVLLSHSDCVDELDVGVPVPKKRLSPTMTN